MYCDRTNLLVGRDRAFLEQRAKEIAADIIGRAGEHPDLHLFYPEGKQNLHLIEKMLDFAREVFLPPYSAPSKVFIITSAERMLPASSNALLKTLEEPPARTTILLLAPSKQELLPTIVSRCQIHYILATNYRLIDEQEGLVKEIILLLSSEHSYPQLLTKIKAVAQEAEKQEKKKLLLQAILAWYRDIYLIKVKGDTNLLFYPNSLPILQECAHLPAPPLEQVQNSIRHALSQLERSVPFSIILEGILCFDPERISSI